jgi:peptidoglycan/LPS O-acetylase OafA/YrhL
MRFYLLDAARGFAAICVVLFHLYSGTLIIENFFLFVDFFFVLSGFVLAPSVSKLSGARQIRKFIWNRFVRLFPMAYSALFVVIFIQLTVNLKYKIAGEILSNSIPLDPLTILASILFLQVFSANSQLLLYPLWSLSSEWLANLFASLISFLSMSKKIALFILPGFFFIGLSITIEVNPDLQNLTNQIGRGLLGFGLGLLVWKLKDRFLLPTRQLLLITISIAAPILAFYVNYISLFTAMFLSPILFSFSILTLYRLEICINLNSAKNICRYLGKTSYGIYVWHVVATNIVSLLSKNIGWRIFEPQILHGIPRLTLVLIITICLTEVVLRLIEVPIRKKLSYV